MSSVYDCVDSSLDYIQTDANTIVDAARDAAANDRSTLRWGERGAPMLLAKHLSSTLGCSNGFLRETISSRSKINVDD